MHGAPSPRVRWPLLLLAVALSVAVSLAPCTPCQDPAAAPQPERPSARYVVLQNLTPFARHQLASAVVPFAEGVAFDPPQLCVDDRPTVWQPFGARWPDGSWRQALCLFRVQIDALRELRLPLIAGTRQFDEQTIEMPAARITLVARVGGQVRRADPERVQDLESNAARRVELRRCRIGDTGLVAELIVTAWRDASHADVSLSVFFSDPGTEQVNRAIEELAVECRDMAIVLRHPGYLGVRQTQTAYGSRAVLLRNTTLADGQGVRRVGAMVPPLGDDAAANDTLRAVATAPLLATTSWRETDAFGPYGVVAPPPPWLEGEALRRHFAVRHQAFTGREKPGGDPFAVGPFGLERMAGQTGDQADFGVCKLSPIAWSGVPSMLLEVEPSVLQEACRPVHFFAADGAPVDPADHPEWVVWSGRTHWHGGVSKDRLGKPVPEPPLEAHGWTGKDRQHWSNNHLAAYALLTGAHWARRELENEGRLYLAGQTLDERFTTSHSGAPRGAGRTLLAASWNLCATADERLRERMVQRVEQVHWREWAGRELPADKVRPMAVNEPDARMLNGQHRYWNPWQDALAAIGFGACHRMTGSARARELAEALACNVVRHGWRVDERHCVVAMAMRWRDGRPFEGADWRSDDETLVMWGFDTAFSEWSFGAVEIARVVAGRDGDEALLAKCVEIQRRMRAGRRPPPREYPHLGGYDRLAEWDAVQWSPR